MKFTVNQCAFLSGWWLNICLFSTLLGQMIQFDEHLFQMGWFNHQLEQDWGNFQQKSYPLQNKSPDHFRLLWQTQKGNVCGSITPFCMMEMTISWSQGANYWLTWSKTVDRWCRFWLPMLGVEKKTFFSPGVWESHPGQPQQIAGFFQIQESPSKLPNKQFQG